MRHSYLATTRPLVLRLLATARLQNVPHQQLEGMVLVLLDLLTRIHPPRLQGIRRQGPLVLEAAHLHGRLPRGGPRRGVAVLLCGRVALVDGIEKVSDVDVGLGEDLVRAV